MVFSFDFSKLSYRRIIRFTDKRRHSIHFAQALFSTKYILEAKPFYLELNVKSGYSTGLFIDIYTYMHD